MLSDIENYREDIFSEELESEKFLEIAIKVIERENLISSIRRLNFYNDEPKFFSYSTNLNNICHDYAGGSSLSPQNTLIKTLGETIERYYLSEYHENNFKIATFDQVRDKSVNIFNIVAFSKNQLNQPKFNNFKFDENTKFNWVEGFSIFQNKKVLIPAQLVYVPYYFKNEKRIRLPITTGAACGSSLGGAIYRGICEIIERDAFMITYLNKLSRNQMDFSKSSFDFQKLKHIYQKYNLDLRIIDITTDINVSSMMGILIDKTNFGPVISVGLASDIDPYYAAINAAEEAQHSRPWIRSEMENKENKIDLNETKGRGLYWANINMLNKASFLYSSKTKFAINKYLTKKRYTVEKLKSVLSLLRDKKYDIYFVEVTPKKIRKDNIRVIKVIIPQLQPLFLDEDFPYLGGDRLKTVSKIIGFSNKNILNDIPHPFL